MNFDILNDHLNKTFLAQKAAYLNHPYPTYDERISKIKQVKQKLLERKTSILEAFDRDFGHREHYESTLSEFLPLISSTNYILKHLKGWMKPEKRHTSLLHLPSKNYVFYQPKGVIGIMVPWNYPLLLSVIPIVYALASGNRVMVKLSEYTPQTETVLKHIFEEIFNEDEVCFISGDHTIAQAFSKLSFDHLFFTGSTNVGKLVMNAASDNLTPVTLELGGKSPVILTEDANLKKAAQSIGFAKYVNSGQTCIAPDYVYCPESILDRFIEQLTKTWTTFTENSNKKLTSIITDRHLDRIKDLIDDAKDKGGIIKILGQNMPYSDDQLSKRQLPLCIISNTNDEMDILKEEIFGPILPIVTYHSFDEVIDKINAKPRPLSLYFYGSKEKFNQILKNTHAGGVCFNDALMQIAQDDLPFGGIGHSGMGSYHAKEGFITFSHPKAVHQKSKISFTSVAYPPFGGLLKFIFKWWIR